MGLFDGLIEGIVDIGLRSVESMTELGFGTSALMQEISRRQAIEKPGEFCIPACIPDDSRCQGCLELENKLLDKIRYIERLSAPVESTVSSNDVGKSYIKCSVCGAPVDNTKSGCPYCGTTYPSYTDSSVPNSEIDRNKLVDKAILDAWQSVLDFLDHQSSVLRTIQLDGMAGKFQQFISGMWGNQGVQGYCKATPDDIRWAASEYGMSVHMYIYSFVKGKATSPVLARMKLSNGEKLR